MSEPIKTKALVIFSGVQDSTTCLFWALKRFDHVEALTFNYGQRHFIELDCARRICARHNVLQTEVSMNFLNELSSNALTDSSLVVSGTCGFQNLPSTFVPGRNILFLTLAASFAAPRGISNVIMGICESDYSGYPDCRENFIASMQQSLSLGLDYTIQIHRPLMNLTKAQTFAMADKLGVLDEVLRESHSCYQGVRDTLHAWGYGCGTCPACELRKRGFEEFSAPTSNPTKKGYAHAPS